MTKITFLIGNGFDINCGIKTSYNDFYPIYLKQESNSEIIQNFKNDLDENIDKWADFEMSMAKYAAHFNSEKELITCTRDFRKKLCAYLTEQEKLFFNKITTEEQVKDINNETNRTLNTFYNGLSKNITRSFQNPQCEYSFITFNYTHIIDQILLKFKQSRMNYLSNDNIQLFHVHGSLDDNPILGIDNLDQISVTYKITDQGKRTIVKPYYNEQYDKTRIINCQNTIHQSDCLCVYGLSLGDSDLFWKNEIKNWILSNSLHQIFFYIKELISYKNLDFDEMQDIEENNKNKILELLDLRNNQEILKQIHLPCGNEIFNYKSIFSKTINNNVDIMKNENKTEKNKIRLFKIHKKIR